MKTIFSSLLNGRWTSPRNSIGNSNSTKSNSNEVAPGYSCEAGCCFGHWRLGLFRRRNDGFVVLLDASDSTVATASRRRQLSAMIDLRFNLSDLDFQSWGYHQKLQCLLQSRFIHDDLLNSIIPLPHQPRTNNFEVDISSTIGNNGDVLPIAKILAYIRRDRSGRNFYTFHEWHDDFVCQIVRLAPEVTRYLFKHRRDGHLGDYDDLASLSSYSLNDGYLLQACIVANITIDTIKCVHELYPEALVHVDNDGTTSLHLAIINLHSATCPSGATLREGQHCIDTIWYILLQNPSLIKLSNHQNKFPLHMLLESKVLPHGGEELIWYVYQSFPEAAIQQDKEGNTPLHLAMKSMKSCQREFGSYPDANKKTKTHIALAMLQKYPHLCKVFNDDGYLPLHLASATISEIDSCLLQEIYLSYPKAIETVTRNNSCLTPLHLACRHFFLVQTSAARGISALLNTSTILSWCPRIIMQRDGRGYLPFQQSCFDREAPRFFFKSLFSSSTSIMVQNACALVEENTGNTLLHLVTETPSITVKTNHHDIMWDGPFLTNVTNVLIHVIINYAPHLVKCQNANGDLPLHLLMQCHHKNHSKSILSLVKYYPESACTRDSKNSFYPFMSTAVMGDVETTFELLKGFLCFQRFSEI